MRRSDAIISVGFIAAAALTNDRATEVEAKSATVSVPTGKGSAKDLLAGKLHSSAFAPRFLLFDSSKDGGTVTAMKDVSSASLPASGKTVLSLSPYYFNAPDNMFASNRKARATLRIRAEQITKNDDVNEPLGWDQSYALIPADPNGDDHVVPSIWLGGSAIATFQEMAIQDGQGLLKIYLQFFVNKIPTYLRDIDKVLADARILTSGIASIPVPQLSLPAASLTALATTSQLLSVIEKLYPESTETIYYIDDQSPASAEVTSVPFRTTNQATFDAASTVQFFGTQDWIILPDVLVGPFLDAVSQHKIRFDSNAQRLLLDDGNNESTSVLDAYPYITFHSEVKLSNAPLPSMSQTPATASTSTPVVAPIPSPSPDPR